MLQRCNHCPGTGQAGTGFVCAEFAFAREPHGDCTGQEAQHHFREDGRYVVGNATAFFVLEDHLVDEVADDPCEEHHEGVHHALYQRQGDHVAVGYVTDLVGQYRLHFVVGKAFQHTLAHRNERVVLVPAGGKGVGFIGREDPDLRHLDSGLAGQLLNGLQQPLFMPGAWLGDDLGAGAHLCHPLGDEQREQ